MKLFNENCADGLNKLEDNSIDLIVTDPPYGLNLMGKKWDKALPPHESFEEMIRILKPGAFIFVMCTPRSDLQARMSFLLENAGFNIAFTPIYWTYASGFPKASKITKQIEKRKNKPKKIDKTKYEGAYAGFQPKPAVEVILVAMKPPIKKTYIDQCLENEHGITWLDNCRIPLKREKRTYQQGRFPANLLVSDDSLNNRKIYEYRSKRKFKICRSNGKEGEFLSSLHKPGHLTPDHSDKGSYSKYFDLDAWFAIIPKANLTEKNKGLKQNHIDNSDRYGGKYPNSKADRNKNTHPTVKPIKLMSYLITLGSRPGQTVLDPFMGTGTTGIASKILNRKFIGFEISVKIRGKKEIIEHSNNSIIDETVRMFNEEMLKSCGIISNMSIDDMNEGEDEVEYCQRKMREKGDVYDEKRRMCLERIIKDKTVLMKDNGKEINFISKPMVLEGNFISCSLPYKIFPF